MPEQNKKKEEKKETPSKDAKKESKPAPKKPEGKGYLAAILIRGLINSVPDVRATLEDLNLTRKNACVVMKDTPTARGMLRKAKDYVTWGEISEDTYKKMKKERKTSTENYFRLHPPRGGFERKGIKRPFRQGGALGNRGKEMDNLVVKML